MYAESQKIHLIEELLKVESDAILAELENVLAKGKAVLPRSNSFQPLTNSLTVEEINELERVIEEGCEQINADDWK